jgi:hypothetical protein
MAATVGDIRLKLDLYYNSSKMTKINGSYIRRVFNYEPFSVRKTSTTMEQIFSKIFHNMKGTHNRRYLKDFFPYYVFYDTIFDLDGHIVFYANKSRNTQGNYVFTFHITKDFYVKYATIIDQFFINRWGGGLGNTENYRSTKVIHEGIDDIYFLFHKQYSFDNLSQRKGFKEELLKEINNKFLYKKDIYLQGLPF